MPTRTVTFSKNVFLPLTTVCRNRCGYCIFRTPVGDHCIMAPEEATDVLARGAMAGCTEALFTFGEKPESEPGFSTYIHETGYDSILEYCHALCRVSIGAGLLPHTNAGVLDYDDLAYLKPVNASMGLMLETTADVPAHHNSPGKLPEARIETIENAGKLKIPFTTGLLLGIGETMEDREESLVVIRDLHRKYDHIQEVIIQNFCPKPGTPMAREPPITFDEFCVVIRFAREILPDDIAIQVAPNLADAPALVRCGVDDLGGISPLTIDHVNPEHPWPEVENLRNSLGDVVLEERLCIYPKYIHRGWVSGELKPLVNRLQAKLESGRL
ncbi:MAG TPA: 7,8-didemethyl-8-hydroxy-5-deazariboflavin synthase subunit CofG [Methanoregulaceae archaeon]|nr:7,8-didemethyl-8-hydroxy-5-deazariboflavin synthase subunit CofG [Methanoregulaceae archaeon]